MTISRNKSMAIVAAMLLSLSGTVLASIVVRPISDYDNKKMHKQMSNEGYYNHYQDVLFSQKMNATPYIVQDIQHHNMQDTHNPIVKQQALMLRVKPETATALHWYHQYQAALVTNEMLWEMFTNNSEHQEKVEELLTKLVKQNHRLLMHLGVTRHHVKHKKQRPQLMHAYTIGKVVATAQAVHNQK